MGRQSPTAAQAARNRSAAVNGAEEGAYALDPEMVRTLHGEADRVRGVQAMYSGGKAAADAPQKIMTGKVMTAVTNAAGKVGNYLRNGFMGPPKAPAAPAAPKAMSRAEEDSLYNKNVKGR